MAKTKTRKQNFSGIVPRFWGGFYLCVFLPHEEWPEQKNINKFWAPTQSRDNPANLLMFMRVFLSLTQSKFWISSFRTVGDPKTLENKADSLPRLVPELCYPQYGLYPGDAPEQFKSRYV